jgi:hypothetical protein
VIGLSLSAPFFMLLGLREDPRRFPTASSARADRT